jgi:hypothetical protein
MFGMPNRKICRRFDIAIIFPDRKSAFRLGVAADETGQQMGAGVQALHFIGSDEQDLHHLTRHDQKNDITFAMSSAPL